MKKIILFFPILIFAQNDISQDILNSTKNEIFNTKNKMIYEKYQINKYNWLSNFNLNAFVKKDENEQKSTDMSVSFVQDIFQFGGINSKMNYANELKKLDLIELKIDINANLQALYDALVEYNIANLSLQKNTLDIKNNEINIKNKKSSYSAGQSDINDLNDALMKQNALLIEKKQIQLQKITAISLIKQYTNKDVNLIKLPFLKPLDKNFFIKNALKIKKSHQNSHVYALEFDIQKTSYLPKLYISANYGYLQTQKQHDDYYSYGIGASMKISYTYDNDLQLKRLQMLENKQNINDIKLQYSLIYDKAIASIENLKEKMNLIKNDILLYKELLSQTSDEYKAGYKSKDDVDILQNTIKLRQIDLDIFLLNIKHEQLNLYFLLA